jgi:hypothetical protein
MRASEHGALTRSHLPPLIAYDNLQTLLDRLRAKYPANLSYAQSVQHIAHDKNLQTFLFRMLKSDANAIRDLESLENAITFYEAHPTWWEQNVEAFFEKMTEQARAQTSEGFERTKFDIEVGINKGIYNFGKGLVMSVWEIAKLGYRLRFDSEFQTTVSKTLGEWTIKYFKLQFGSPAQQAEVIHELTELGNALLEALAKKVVADWEQATTQGKRDELIAKWVTLGLLEIATFALAATKARKATRGVQIIEEGTATRAEIAEVVSETRRLPNIKNFDEARAFLKALPEKELIDTQFQLRRSFVKGVREMQPYRRLENQPNHLASQAWREAFAKHPARKYAPIEVVRRGYAEEIARTMKVADSLLADGKTEEAVAREVQLLRRQIGIKYKFATSPAERPSIYLRNMSEYGDAVGPSIEHLRGEGKSWRQIIESAKRSNRALDKHLGVIKDR